MKQLFQKEEIQKRRHDQTRELIAKNTKLISSLKKSLELQNDIDFDADKAKKVRDYEIWCKDLQEKQSKVLATLKGYEKLLEDRKEDYYNVVARIDEKEDKIISLQEEIGRLELQVEFNKQILAKSYA